MGWTDDFAARRKASVLGLDFETKPLDPISIVKSLGQQRETELRLKIREAYLSDL